MRARSNLLRAEHYLQVVTVTIERQQADTQSLETVEMMLDAPKPKLREYNEGRLGKRLILTGLKQGAPPIAYLELECPQVDVQVRDIWRERIACSRRSNHHLNLLES